MTLGSPKGAVGGRRWPLAALIAAGVALVVLVVTASADGLVYYRTPTEVIEGPRDGAVLRVGGYVLPGTIVRDDAESRFVLTDGKNELAVTYAGPLPGVVQEGEGAVAEGVWSGGGTLAATEVLLRHSNEYRAPEVSSPR
ncbi:cytochrome c maturation protein CcmE [Demequina sp. SO4-13]|uniref:cytochrome c maturation protein CcmE n=1 Tax=Demequina sp. SO4-13 TaxID=3401027 RepID=UPI003AF97C87